MITERLYYKDSYIKKFNAVVKQCEENNGSFKIILDKTAFFPEGGGQLADSGVIGDAIVKDVQIVNGEIIHYCDKALAKGIEYACSINWKERFRRMQQHTGEHIVSGIVHSKFGYDNVGFHMEDNYVTIDFNGELSRAELDLIESDANNAVYSNYNINCFFPLNNELDKYNYRSKLELTEDVRLVEIENVDLCACCAPHLKKTGEVGIIKLLDFMRHRGGVRIILKCGSDALEDYREKYNQVYEVSNLLSAKQNEISFAVNRIIGDVDSLKKEFYDFKLSVAESEKNNLKYVNNCSYTIVDNFDSDMMREVVNFGMEKSKLSIVFSGNDSKGYAYVAGSFHLDMKSIAKEINSSLNGRGGGRDTMIQGKVNTNKDSITEFISNL